MSMEGLPSEPLDNDLAGAQESLEAMTDAQVLEAMRSGDFKAVGEWYSQQEDIADKDPTPQGRLDLTLRMAKFQIEAGLKEYALNTLEDAYTDAYQRGDDQSAERIQSMIEQIKD